MIVPAQTPRSAPPTARPRAGQLRSNVLAAIVALVLGGCGGTATPGSPTTAGSASPSAAVSAMPAWIAALGGRILFTKEAGSPTTFTVMTMAPDGTDLRTIVAPSPTSIVHVVWGPGSRFTFDSDRAGQNQVFSMDAAGNDVRPLSSGPHGHGWPAVSRDGSSVVFDDWIDQTDFGLLLTRADGSPSNPRALTTSADPAKGGDTQPAFSPDDKRVAFQRWVTPDPADPKAVTAAIFVVGIDGKGLRQLTPYDMDAGLPRWSPDGSTILFTDHADTFNLPNTLSANLWTVRPDGSGLAQLTRETGGNFAAEGSWAPDGSAIVFHSWFGSDSFTAIRVMKADGSEATPVLESPFNQGGAGEMPDWSPSR